MCFLKFFINLLCPSGQKLNRIINAGMQVQVSLSCPFICGFMLLFFFVVFLGGGVAMLELHSNQQLN